eukprot:gene23654-31923_t
MVVAAPPIRSGGVGKMRPCRFWKVGLLKRQDGCTKGDGCKFTHRLIRCQEATAGPNGVCGFLHPTISDGISLSAGLQLGDGSEAARLDGITLYSHLPTTMELGLGPQPEQTRDAGPGQRRGPDCAGPMTQRGHASGAAHISIMSGVAKVALCNTPCTDVDVTITGDQVSVVPSTAMQYAVRVSDGARRRAGNAARV